MNLGGLRTLGTGKLFGVASVPGPQCPRGTSSDILPYLVIHMFPHTYSLMDRFWVGASSTETPGQDPSTKH